MGDLVEQLEAAFERANNPWEILNPERVEYLTEKVAELEAENYRLREQIKKSDIACLVCGRLTPPKED